MVRLRTKREIEIFDKRLNSLGSFVIRMVVNEITANGSNAVATGFYCYINADNEEKLLDNFSTNFSWEVIGTIENNLPNFNDPKSLKLAFIQRIVEFSFIQQQQESGSNYGTVAEDWELDIED